MACSRDACANALSGQVIDTCGPLALDVRDIVPESLGKSLLYTDCLDPKYLTILYRNFAYREIVFVTQCFQDAGLTVTGHGSLFGLSLAEPALALGVPLTIAKQDGSFDIMDLNDLPIMSIEFDGTSQPKATRCAELIVNGANKLARALADIELRFREAGRDEARRLGREEGARSEALDVAIPESDLELLDGLEDYLDANLDEGFIQDDDLNESSDESRAPTIAPRSTTSGDDTGDDFVQPAKGTGYRTFLSSAPGNLRSMATFRRRTPEERDLSSMEDNDDDDDLASTSGDDDTEARSFSNDKVDPRRHDHLSSTTEVRKRSTSATTPDINADEAPPLPKVARIETSQHPQEPRSRAVVTDGSDKSGSPNGVNTGQVEDVAENIIDDSDASELSHESGGPMSSSHAIPQASSPRRPASRWQRYTVKESRELQQRINDFHQGTLRDILPGETFESIVHRKLHRTYDSVRGHLRRLHVKIPMHNSAYKFPVSGLPPIPVNDEGLGSSSTRRRSAEEANLDVDPEEDIALPSPKEVLDRVKAADGERHADLGPGS